MTAVFVVCFVVFLSFKIAARRSGGPRSIASAPKPRPVAEQRRAVLLGIVEKMRRG